MQTLGQYNSLVENVNTPRSQNTRNKDVFICAVRGSYASRGPRKCWFQVSIGSVAVLSCYGDIVFFGLLGFVEVIHLSQRFVYLRPGLP